MKLKVYMKPGGFLEYDQMNGFHFDMEDGTVNLMRFDETIIVIPRENVMWIEEEEEYDQNSLN